MVTFKLLYEADAYASIQLGHWLNFFEKKIKAVSLLDKTVSLSDIINKNWYILKLINSNIHSNFFIVFGLPTGCRAVEGHSINFAKQNSSNVPAVQTQR